MLGLQPSDGLGASEPLGQGVDQHGIQIVDGLAQIGQDFLCAFGVRRLASALDSEKKAAPRISDGLQPLVRSKYRGTHPAAVAAETDDSLLRDVVRAEAKTEGTRGSALRTSTSRMRWWMMTRSAAS